MLLDDIALPLKDAAEARAFREAFPALPAEALRALWEDRFLEALALEWFAMRQGLLEAKGEAFAGQAYRVNLRSGLSDTLAFSGFMCKGQSTYSASAEKKNKAFLSALSTQIEAYPSNQEAFLLLRRRLGGRADIDLRSQSAALASVMTSEHLTRNRAAVLEQAFPSVPARSPVPRL